MSHFPVHKSFVTIGCLNPYDDTLHYDPETLTYRYYTNCLECRRRLLYIYEKPPQTLKYLTPHCDDALTEHLTTPPISVKREENRKRKRKARLRAQKRLRQRSSTPSH